MPTQIVTPKTFTAGMRNAIYSESTLDDFIESVGQQPEGSGLTATAQEVGLNLRTLARTVRVSAEEYRDLTSDLQAAIGWKLVFGKNRQRDATYGQIVESMHQLDEHSERYVSARRLMQLLIMKQLRMSSTAHYSGQPEKFNPSTGLLKGHIADLSDYDEVWYPPASKTKSGVQLPRKAEQYRGFIEGDHRRLMNLLNIIEAATDKESIDGIAQRRDFLEERMNASYYAFVAAEWEANQVTKWYENLLPREAYEERKKGVRPDKLERQEAKMLMHTMKAARISLPVRLIQSYRDLWQHHATELYAVGMVALTTSTVGAAAGLLPPVGDIIPPLANVEPLKFLGSYVWSLITGAGMYGLTQAGPWTAGKLRSKGRYVQV